MAVPRRAQALREAAAQSQTQPGSQNSFSTIHQLNQVPQFSSFFFVVNLTGSS